MAGPARAVNRKGSRYRLICEQFLGHRLRCAIQKNPLTAFPHNYIENFSSGQFRCNFPIIIRSDINGLPDPSRHVIKHLFTTTYLTTYVSCYKKDCRYGDTSATAVSSLSLIHGSIRVKNR